MNIPRIRAFRARPVLVPMKLPLHTSTGAINLTEAISDRLSRLYLVDDLVDTVADIAAEVAASAGGAG